MNTTNPAAPTGEELTFHSPVLITRVKANMIDGLFILVMMFVAGDIFGRFGQAPAWSRVATLFFILGVYEPVFTSFGATLGHAIMKIRVRRIDNIERPIHIAQAYTRFFIKVLFGMLSIVTIHFNRERRAIHDFAGQSVMIALE